MKKVFFVSLLFFPFSMIYSQSEKPVLGNFSVDSSKVGQRNLPKPELGNSSTFTGQHTEDKTPVVKMDNKEVIPPEKNKKPK